MESNIIHTLDHGERVTSSYAEIYLNDDHCDYKKLPIIESSATVEILSKKSKIQKEESLDAEWISPSDLLIGIIELKPPFTSKITRGTTHGGILDIGDQILSSEHAKFMRHLTTLINENDSAWSHILEHEKASVKDKVKEIYGKIFMEKSKIMQQEINAFYETTLQELEKNLKCQVDNVMLSAHASIISDLNTEIKQKLQNERIIIEDVLKKRYETEVAKINQYYKLLLNNELYRNNKLVNKALIERNDALKAFYRQVEAENITSTMYILCLERKKCKIQQFILENYQSLELSEKYNKIKERQDMINVLKEKDVHISEINKNWQEKIKKVLQIFLKFISFSLKLLPEQTTFLLDLEKMFLLQLNEIQKTPKKAPSIIMDEEKVQNIFKFDKLEKEENVCTNEPYVIVGDLSDPIPPHYGSRETLPSDVDLPTVRLARQFTYARCHDYEEIKTLLEAHRCKCSDKLPNKPSQSVSTDSNGFEEVHPLTKKESSNELLLLDDFQRLHECPVRRCKDWAKRMSFPVLDSYLDFNEENYSRVKSILGKIPKKDPAPELVNPKHIVFTELPFSATKEQCHTVETQYSSQEDLIIPDIECPCLDDVMSVPHKQSSFKINEPGTKALDQILAKRKVSLRRMLQENTNLLKMFTDECFDFIL